MEQMRVLENIQMQGPYSDSHVDCDYYELSPDVTLVIYGNSWYLAQEKFDVVAVSEYMYKCLDSGKV